MKFVVLAVNRADGKVLWQRTVRDAWPHEATHVTGSWASHSVVTDGRRVYASFGSAGIYALEHHIERLAEDHGNAKRFAEHIHDAPGISVDLDAVETNMVRFDVAGTGLRSAAFADRLLSEEGVRVSVLSPTALRAVSHLEISQSQIDTAGESVCALAKRIAKGD